MPSSGCKKCARSEEHTSELQSHDNLVCRLLLEKKKDPPRRPVPLALHSTEHPAAARTHARQGAGSRWGRLNGGSLLALAGVFVFFFFKERAPPDDLPFSPPLAFAL